MSGRDERYEEKVVREDHRVKGWAGATEGPKEDFLQKGRLSRDMEERRE